MGRKLKQERKRSTGNEKEGGLEGGEKFSTSNTGRGEGSRFGTALSKVYRLSREEN